VSPEKRGVIPLDTFHLPRRLARTIRSGAFQVTADRCFRQVMEAASGMPLSWFFDQWLKRPGLPTLRGSWRFDAAAKQVRIELAQSSGRGITWIRKHGLALSHALFVHLLEAIERVVDLAANFDSTFWSVARKSQRHIAQSSEIFSYDLADQSIPTRRSCDEHTILISECHGGSVDLQFHRVTRLCDVIACKSNQPLFPCAKLVVIECVAE